MILIILTYNILDGGIGREDLIAGIIAETGSDIILLQEVSSLAVIRKLADRLKMDFRLTEGNSRRNLAVLTRFPIVSSNSFAAFPLRNALLEAKVEYASGRILTLFGVHLAPYYHVVFEMWRYWEAKVILRRIKQLKEVCFVLAGDLNAIAPEDLVDITRLPVGLQLMLRSQGGFIPRNVIATIQSTGLIDCYRWLHPKQTGYTLPSSAPHARFDYFFVHPLLRANILKCEIVKQPGFVRDASDHLPLLLRLQMDSFT